MKDDIIGISGLQRSGKDTLAEKLIKDGYYGVSLGDIVRDFARRRHADKADPVSIRNLTDTSNWLRETRGADAVLQEALERYKIACRKQSYKGLVLYSIRAPIEVDWILSHGGRLIWVEASDQTRYQRFIDHLRTDEVVVSLEDYTQQEALQWKPQLGIPEAIQMNMQYVKQHATDVIINEGIDLQTFYAQAARCLEQ